MNIDIRGRTAPGFEPVREAFAANFARDDLYRDVGASLAVYRGNECLVDLWGGSADAEGTRPWTRDTLVNVWSTTKGITAIALAVLVDRGLIDYAAPVARYWPEFAAKGKGAVTVSQLLSHQGGLPGFIEPTSLEAFYDFDTITARLAEQPPMWPPGTKNSYHAMTYGFLAGELIRRVSGTSVGRFVASELAAPLEADIFIGLPEKEEPRVAALIGPRIAPEFDPAVMPPEAIAAVSNPAMEPTLPNRRDWRAAEIPAGNGHATAHGLARLYAPIANGGRLDGVTLMQPETVAALCTVQTERPDVMLGITPFWRNGLSGNAQGIYGPNPNAVGHSGWGGSFGCADREAGLSIGYVMNQMGVDLVGDSRATALCRAIYACLPR